MSWQPLPEDAPLDHEALSPPDAGFAALPAGAQLDAPEGSGFSDEQMQSIRDYLPQAKDAADLERFSLELSGGKAKIGNAQDILDKMKGGAKADAFAFTPPTIDKAMHPPAPNAGAAFTNHVANALALDYGPEVGGVIDTILHGGTIKGNAAHERAILEGQSEAHRIASTAGELVGVGLTVPLTMGAGAEGYAVSHGSRVAGLARASAEGAVYGSGAAGPGNRAAGAAEGAILAPVVGAAIKAPFAAYDATKSVLEGAPGMARKIVAKAIKADENTPASVGADMMAAHANDVPMMLADSGENARGLLAATGRSSGPARTIARDALESRQAGLAERVTGTIERDLGPVSNPHEVADTLMTKARNEAAPLYEAAYARPGAGTFAQKVEPLLARPSMKGALQKAYRIAQEEGRDPTTLGFDLDAEGNVTLKKVPSWQTLDYIKRGADDVVEGYKNKVTGRYDFDTEGKAVNNTLRSFLGAFDTANPDYAAARAAYGGPVSGITAMNAGRKALNMTADDLEARMRNMTPFEKQMFALGTRRAMAELVDSKGGSADVVNALVGTGKKRAMLGRLFGDRPAFNRFVQTMNQEKEGFRTFKQALTGSPTAANLSDDRALELATAVVETAATGVPWRLAMKHALKFGVGKVGDKTKQQVAALLSETDPTRFQELAAQLREEATRRGIFHRKVGIVTRGAGDAVVASQAQ